jgi:hypothetical protein
MIMYSFGNVKKGSYSTFQTKKVQLSINEHDMNNWRHYIKHSECSKNLKQLYFM